MLFALQELVRWLGLTVFEMLVHLIALLVFTIFLALRLDDVAFASTIPGSYDIWIVFSPLFVADALCTYFNIIVLIRLYIEGHIKEAVTRTELENMLAVFDFDQTIVDGNSDIVAIDLISPTNLVPNRKDFPNNWTQYMQRVFDIIRTIEIPAEQIIDVVSLMRPNNGMPKLMRALYENNVDIIVASDSNSLFIYNWLKHNKLSDIVSCIYTNPATISDSAIKIEPYAVQNKCNWCTTNMCKGAIMEEHALNTNKKYDKILYFGDGQNDLCPVLKLTKNDIAFPRLGYILENLLKSHITPAKVMPWCTGEYIYEFLKSSKLISA